MGSDGTLKPAGKRDLNVEVVGVVFLPLLVFDAVPVVAASPDIMDRWGQVDRGYSY